jgi:hypothetical protein
MVELVCNKRTDPVDRLVKDISAEEIVDWMIEYHGLSKDSRRTVVSNLRDNLHFHRLRGRLDRTPWLANLVELWIRSKK